MLQKQKQANKSNSSSIERDIGQMESLKRTDSRPSTPVPNDTALNAAKVRLGSKRSSSRVSSCGSVVEYASVTERNFKLKIPKLEIVDCVNDKSAAHELCENTKAIVVVDNQSQALTETAPADSNDVHNENAVNNENSIPTIAQQVSECENVSETTPVTDEIVQDVLMQTQSEIDNSTLAVETYAPPPIDEVNSEKNNVEENQLEKNPMEESQAEESNVEGIEVTENQVEENQVAENIIEEIKEEETKENEKEPEIELEAETESQIVEGAQEEAEKEVKDNEEEEEEVVNMRTPLDELIRAASIMNPRQFEIPRELNIYPQFPGDERSEYKNFVIINSSKIKTNFFKQIISVHC